MVKNFGLLVVLTSLLLVGCASEQTATEDEATQGMDNIESYGESVDAGAGAK